MTVPFPIYSNLKEYINSRCKEVLTTKGALHTLSKGKGVGTLAAINKEEVIQSLRDQKYEEDDIDKVDK